MRSRWYLSFKLNYRDLVNMMSERGIGLAHTTILRWLGDHDSADFEVSVAGTDTAQHCRGPLRGGRDTYIKREGRMDALVVLHLLPTPGVGRVGDGG